jgi:hypothetical protein
MVYYYYYYYCSLCIQMLLYYRYWSGMECYSLFIRVLLYAVTNELQMGIHATNELFGNSSQE